MAGLIQIGEQPERFIRPEYQMIIDEPVYDAVRRFATIADMQEIDGWSRSFYTREGHLESIASYAKPLIQEPNDPYWNEAKAITRAEIANLFPPVNSLTFETHFDQIPYESSSAAGHGYNGKKGEGNNFNRAKGIANALVRSFDERCATEGYGPAVEHAITNSTPDVSFTRTQLAKLPSIKVRNVFGEAFHYILVEGLSAAPLLATFKREDTFYFTGKDPTYYVPNMLIKQGLSPGWFIALDWKSFDATVQLWEIEHAFDCIEQLLNFPTQLSHRAYQLTKELFMMRKLASPDGKLYIRTGGIPSGSYYTNLIGSVINYARIRFICCKLGYNIESVRVQGDDSVIKIRNESRPDIWQIAEVGNSFGWQLNAPKCVITHRSSEVTFLGRSQHLLYNTRERLKVLRLMCFPEYQVEEPTISTARVKAIASDAG